MRPIVMALTSLLALPLGIYTTVYMWKNYRERELVKANSGTIVLHLLAGTLLDVGLWLGAGVLKI